MRIGKESVERQEGIVPHPDFHGRDGRGAEPRGGAPSEHAGEEASGNYGQSENGRADVVRVGYPNGENMGVPQDFPNSRRKFRMDVGYEEYRGFRSDFFRDLPHGHGWRNF